MRPPSLTLTYTLLPYTTLFRSSGKETVSTEQIISLKPDLAIFGAGSHGPDAKSADIIRQLEAAGIPIVFIDFRLHPFKNTVPSMSLRSEEHTSELQSLMRTSYAVFSLKKKNTTP